MYKIIILLFLIIGVFKSYLFSASFKKIDSSKNIVVLPIGDPDTRYKYIKYLPSNIKENIDEYLVNNNYSLVNIYARRFSKLELEYSQSGMSEKTLEIGKHLSVDLICYGHIKPYVDPANDNDDFPIEFIDVIVKILDVETTKVVFIKKLRYFPISDIDNITEYLFKNKKIKKKAFKSKVTKKKKAFKSKVTKNRRTLKNQNFNLFLTFSYYLRAYLTAHDNRNIITEFGTGGIFDTDVTFYNYLWRHSYLNLGLGFVFWHSGNLKQMDINYSKVGSYSLIQIEFGTLLNDFDSGSEFSLNNKNIVARYRYTWHFIFLGAQYTYFSRINTPIVSYDRDSYLVGIEFGFSIPYYDIIFWIWQWWRRLKIYKLPLPNILMKLF